MIIIDLLRLYLDSFVILTKVITPLHETLAEIYCKNTIKQLIPPDETLHSCSSFEW
jgi:hypothetical protein